MGCKTWIDNWLNLEGESGKNIRVNLLKLQTKIEFESAKLDSLLGIYSR